MGSKVERNDITKAAVVYRIPGMEAVRLHRDVEYSETEDGALTMDLYLPPDCRPESPTPGVVMVSGYPDPGHEAALGCKFKETSWCVSWARLIAVSGLAAITYTNRDPVADLEALLAGVQRHAGSLGIDAERMGLLACSGNVPMALSLLMEGAPHVFRCAALCYGFKLDVRGSNRVAEAAARFRFVNPCTGRSVDDLHQGLPLFVARAGRDEMPGLNETLDSFVGEALGRNLPLTLVNLPEAPHAFDLLDDRAASRETIQRILEFQRLHLLEALAKRSRL